MTSSKRFRLTSHPHREESPYHFQESPTSDQNYDKYLSPRQCWRSEIPKGEQITEHCQELSWYFLAKKLFKSCSASALVQRMLLLNDIFFCYLLHSCQYPLSRFLRRDWYSPHAQHRRQLTDLGRQRAQLLSLFLEFLPNSGN